MFLARRNKLERNLETEFIGVKNQIQICHGRDSSITPFAFFFGHPLSVGLLNEEKKIIIFFNFPGNYCEIYTLFAKNPALLTRHTMPP